MGGGTKALVLNQREGCADRRQVGIGDQVRPVGAVRVGAAQRGGQHGGERLSGLKGKDVRRGPNGRTPAPARPCAHHCRPGPKGSSQLLEKTKRCRMSKSERPRSAFRS